MGTATRLVSRFAWELPMILVHEVKTLLNRRWLRPVLGPLVSQLARRKGSGVQKIFCDDGIWMHQSSSGYFAYREPFVRLNLEQLDAFARSVFFWGYLPRAGDVIVDVRFIRNWGWAGFSSSR